jgi:ribosomal protein S27AE
MTAILTLSEAIEMDFPRALAMMRANYWQVGNHYDVVDETRNRVVWIFISRSGKFVQAEGSTDAQALFYACQKARVPLVATKQCPRCGAYLEIDDQNRIACSRCMLFFWLDCWWTCPEKHEHDNHCYVLADVKQPSREPDFMLRNYLEQQKLVDLVEEIDFPLFDKYRLHRLHRAR